MKLTRRDFLKLVGTSSLLATLDWTALVKKAFAEVKSGSISIVWFEAQDCAGDTTSLIQATNPDILEVLGGLTHLTGPGAVVLPFHETVMPEWGVGSIAHMLLALAGVYDPFVLVLEGAIPPDESLSGIKGSDMLCYIGDMEAVKEAVDKLKEVVEGKLSAEALLPVTTALKAIAPETAKAIINRVVEVVEGGILDKVVRDCFADLGAKDVISCARWFACLMRRAVAVVALGNCAAYGGLVGNTVAFSYGGRNQDLLSKYKSYGYTPYDEWSKQGWSYSPSGGVGFFPDPVRGYKGFAKLLLERGGRLADAARPYVNFIEGRCIPDPKAIVADPTKATCKPAIAVPGCPSNGNAQLRTLANLILWAKGILPLPELDKYWRPKFIFGLTVHEQCPRAAWYAAGVLRKYPGEPTGACLFSVGCKGPIANCPYNKVGWVNGVGGPTRVGGVCIACTMPGFMDAYEPFYKPLPAPTAPAPSTATAIVAAAAVAGAAAAFGVKKLSEKVGKK